MSGHRVDASRLVAVEPARAFDRLIVARLPEIFARRYAAFPAVREVIEQSDEWGTVGQTRTIVLTDGGSLRETLTSVDRPHGFAYVLDDLHGKLAAVREQHRGRLVGDAPRHRRADRLGLDPPPGRTSGPTHHERGRQDVEGVRRSRARGARDHPHALLTPSDRAAHPISLTPRQLLRLGGRPPERPLGVPVGRTTQQARQVVRLSGR